MFRRVKKECIDTIIGKSYVGDWFLFYLLGQNIDSVIFKVESINNNSGLLRIFSRPQLLEIRNFLKALSPPLLHQFVAKMNFKISKLSVY